MDRQTIELLLPFVCIKTVEGPSRYPCLLYTSVHRFIRKFWSLFYDRPGNYLVTDAAAGKEELKSLHKLIKKVTGDIEQFSYNKASVPL